MPELGIRTWCAMILVGALTALGGGCGGSSDSGIGGGGDCTGACAVAGASCTIEPPPGSDAPSRQCICESGTWCCEASCFGMGGASGSSGSGGTSGASGSAGAGGSSGDGGTSGSAGIGGAAGTAGSSGAAGSAGSGGGCAKNCETEGFICCDGSCVNPANDIFNCGKCGNECDGPNPYCDGGQCGAPPCFGTTCAGTQNCCGSECCDLGQICCTVNVGPSVTSCTEPENGTCPLGCPMCVCADPDTPIGTPDGEVAIAELRVGDLVYSMHRGELAVVPIATINRAPVTKHHVKRVTLENGRTLDVSPRHPTADGRTFDDLEPGHSLDGVAITGARLIDYPHAFTYDVLPDSDSGAYFAAGVLIGSTLR